MFYLAYLLNKDSAANKHRIAYLHYIQIDVNLQDKIKSLQKYSENKNKLLPSLWLQRRQQFFQLHRRKNGINKINLIHEQLASAAQVHVIIAHGGRQR